MVYWLCGGGEGPPMDRAVLKFIEQAAAAREVSELNEAFARTMEGYGIEKFAAAILDPVKLKPEHFLATNYPSRWIEHYVDRKYEDVDPVVLRSMAAAQPFVWHENLAPRPARELFAEAKEAGIVSGLAVPVKLKSGQHSVVAVTSEMRPGEFDRLMQASQRDIQTACYCYHDTLCVFTGVDSPRPAPMPALETEVLHWLALGKTGSEIAEILRMAECSVDAHVANAMDRLGLTSRDHLVAEAIRRGFLVAA